MRLGLRLFLGFFLIVGLAAFFGADAWISTRCIDQCDHRQVELFSHVHQALSLAVTFRPCHAEIMFDAALCVVAFFMSHDNAGASLEAAKTAQKSGV